MNDFNIIILNAILGLLPAAIAQQKGRNFFLWYVYGFCLFLIAIIHVLFIPKLIECKNCGSKHNSKYTYCPYCSNFNILGGN